LTEHIKNLQMINYTPTDYSTFDKESQE
jgi:hypothetical protein